MARPSSLVRSSPRLFLPRLACSMSTATLPLNPAMPVDPRPRAASPRVTCSILITSAPQSARTPDAAGTKVCSATSRMRIPSITLAMVRERTRWRSVVRRTRGTVGFFPIDKNVLSAGGRPVIDANELILVSVDDHICEPREMFEGHVPAKYRDRAPRVVEEDDGVEQWWYGDIRGRNIGLNAAAGKAREYFNLDASRYDEMRAGCFDVHERVRDMNAGGQLAGLNFPNWTGFAGQVLNQGPDLDVNMVMIQAYNDWHVDEWCGAYPDRFIPCGILPMWDAELAAGE